jgi:aconitate hydratase
VVAYALAGTVTASVHEGGDGVPPLTTLLPDAEDVARLARQALRPLEVRAAYDDALTSNGGLPACGGAGVPLRFPWRPESTWLRRPPFVERPTPPDRLDRAPVLLGLADDVTTDQVSPAGTITSDSPAGRWLAERGVPAAELGTYGARRANHEVMVRGTFANPHLLDLIDPDRSGGSVHEIAMRLQQAGTPSVVVAGARYGAGSSRDWAAKGTALFGVAAVLARSFERIHRANLAWFGVLPIEVDIDVPLGPGAAVSLDLTGVEVGTELMVLVHMGDGPAVERVGRVRLDSEEELRAWRDGGLLPLTLRRITAPTPTPGGAW